ncbi:MAG TPA: adenylyl-sulfate reductase subunit alpha [Cyanobacteria bacterium UBA9579]|nr:adenylyl-sulfate reductase subunit alpha [Cyanobacteria bacterium UBA9579]
MQFNIKTIETDILIVGGGTAGCYCALTIAENSDYKVIIADKANIKRSGCLAAGVNALNAYITNGETPESFVDYVKKDSEGVIREDLVYSIAQRLNKVTQKIEQLGLPILKDDKGDYITRGKRSIKINGENIKPLLSDAVNTKDTVTVLNRVNIVDYLLKNDRVVGAIGFSLDQNSICIIYAKAVICATGGASGLYKPNNPQFSRHKMWYSPFNTGAGYAMGIRAGAEMTSFEMRFIALRCKDTIAPTGTIAQGINVPQINNADEEYVEKYGKPITLMRLYSTIAENGPCYLKTIGIGKSQEEELFKAYLNMAPAQTLRWLENNSGPSIENVEITGTEPYITGGHTASGYWIDINRKTILDGLYAVGDVAGGSPKKYVTGCFAEGEIAALAVIEAIKDKQINKIDAEKLRNQVESINKFLDNPDISYSIESLEEEMQGVMDEFAGGISCNYSYSKEKLKIASEKIDELLDVSNQLKANNLHELLFIYELIDRLYVSRVVIAHLFARKETRWKCYQENADFPHQDDKQWLCYVNSKYENGNVYIILRDLIGRNDIYEH